MYLTISIVLILIVAALAAGLLLPEERVEVRKSEYNISQKRLFDVVTNNKDYAYRSDIKDIVILNKEGKKQTWKEIKKNGQEIIFRTRKVIPHSYYEFEIVEANGFKGYWTGEFKSKGEDRSELIATEHIVIPNPFIRLLSYIFVDIGKQMETFQKDLSDKVNRIKES